MKNISILIASTMMILSACKEKTRSVEDTAKTATTSVQVPAAENDSAAIHSAIVDFYKWYNKNYNQLMNFDLYSGTRKSDKPPYKINWNEVDKLQAFIRSSVPWLGEEYLLNQRQMLEKADSVFKVDVNDDVPYAFDYDWYTNSQEDPQFTLDEVIRGVWSIQQQGERAKVEIKTVYSNGKELGASDRLKLSMKKEAGQWKISKIGDE